MKKEMLINVLQPEECRIAILEDGVLEELHVERTSHESYTGNIYKGKIVNLEPAIQAAFVDFSVGRNGFLHVSDVEPQYFHRHGAADVDHLETRPSRSRAGAPAGSGSRQEAPATPRPWTRTRGKTAGIPRRARRCAAPIPESAPDRGTASRARSGSGTTARPRSGTTTRSAIGNHHVIATERERPGPLIRGRRDRSEIALSVRRGGSWTNKPPDPDLAHAPALAAVEPAPEAA